MRRSLWGPCGEEILARQEQRQNGQVGGSYVLPRMEDVRSSDRESHSMDARRGRSGLILPVKTRGWAGGRAGCGAGESEESGPTVLRGRKKVRGGRWLCVDRSRVWKDAL